MIPIPSISHIYNKTIHSQYHKYLPPESFGLNFSPQPQIHSLRNSPAAYKKNIRQNILLM